MKEDKALKPIFGRGWSVVNMLAGAGFFIIGYIVLITDFLITDFYFNSPVSAKESFFEWLAIVIIVFGVLGFWLVIPAVRKWWNTKRWLALVFLIIGLAITYPLAHLILWSIWPILQFIKF